ncbi:preprotein translocase, YajC subunit [Gordonia bronchialis DSM 43247]|uniref:Preprotein translocase, YajC subunit n=1 Tax=Gordonia bronchialis (strain ATCC 25592 / DSM 43247 / BCRC 13721 / JCM 3198 / KCTC 3076 / NBRC 16047 / NCTC 10667) TaxID=526226 RepID=D0LCM7_GORB4|nr:preprotein translocase subunit YajC [Gordonia bronchialis]ACY21548.1 preprotein translocase, YajC subunit [Gordonia bronchialis DSM 43247]MCC3324333.1 preprotein translocase subunit YajC [Gordonia bronchialis]QGS24810.1 preprotein translocase subunit YajC [Gordonia bronchialis]STQ64430.1 preprotein translocase subunit YajC [Gordonia bronchialis]
MEFLFPVLLAMLAVFMFMSMRKQKKRMSEMQEMQDSVQTGTRIQLTSGLFGTVIDASSSDVIDVEIATGVVTRWNRLAVMRVIPTEEAAATYPGYVAPETDDEDDDFDVDHVSLDKSTDDAETDVTGTADQKRDGDK